MNNTKTNTMNTQNLISVSDSLQVTAPKNYMEQRFPFLKSDIENGKDYVFNYSLQMGNSIKTALLVAIQTDYNSWNGTKSLLKNL